MTLFQHLEYLLFWGIESYGEIRRMLGFWGGVDLFFCVSGFVITRSLLLGDRYRTTGGSFAHFALPFWIRRAWRLWPAAWLWVLVPLLCSWLFNASGAFGGFAAMAGDALAAVLQLANVHWMRCYNFSSQVCNIVGDQWGGANQPVGWLLVVYWSLSLEEQFYLVLPFLLFWVPRRTLLVTIGCMVILQLLLHRAPLGGLWYFRTEALLLGVMLAFWLGSRSHAALEPRVLRQHAIMLAVFLGLLAIVCRVAAPAYDAWQWSTGGIAVCCAALVWIASYNRRYFLWLGSGGAVMGWLGSRSYSLYLIHMTAYALTREFWYRLGPGNGIPIPTGSGLFLYGILACMILLVLTEFSFRFVERPLREHGRRLVERRYDR